MKQLDNTVFMHILNRIAPSYTKSALLPNEIAERLIAHLDEISLQPKIIVDLGCKTGYSTQLLRQRFPQATVIGLEISSAMLAQLPSAVPSYLLKNYAELPREIKAADLVFANLALSWSPDLAKSFRQIQTLLRPGGFLLFSLFGLDTLQEVQQSWSTLNSYPHVHDFVDMHNIGDLLLQQQLIDPVMETEHLTLLYSSVEKLCRELKISGLQNLHPERYPLLTGKKVWQQFIENYQQFKQPQGLPATFEIIYGHAQKQQKSPQEFVVPIDKIHYNK